MRTHQRKLMLVITILTIVSFVWFYSAHDPSRLQNDEVVRIYDRNVSYSDFQRAMRKFQLALALGLVDYASQLSGGSEQGAGEFAINAMIVEHEGKRLGLRPDDRMVADAIAAIPAFQTNGQFDPAKYEAIYQREFAPGGFTRGEIDEIVRNSLVFDRLRKVLDSVPAVTAADEGFFRRAFQPVTGAAILFERADFAKNAAPTDKQVADFFQANAAQLTTPEWRVARFVRFRLPAGADKLEGKAKIEAQQKVATASDEFSQQAAAEGFEKAAKAAGLAIETTPAFDRSGALQTGGASTPDLAGIVRSLAPAVFTLSSGAPVSRVVESGDQFFVADLASVTDSRAMTLDEARPLIVQQLTATAAQAALDKGVADALASLRKAVGEGKSFTEAAAAAGWKTQPFAAVSLADPAASADQRKYADASLVLNENEVSGFRPEPGGGFAVWIEKRLPADDRKYDESRKDIAAEILSQRQGVLFHDWLANAQKEAGVKFAERGGQG